MSRPGTGNVRLRDWLDRAGWSHHELARRVHAAAVDAGHHGITPDATGVRYWTRGGLPRPPRPALIAAVFSRHFGFTVTPADLGIVLPDRPSVLDTLDLPWRSRSTVVATAECVRADLMIDRREAINDFAGCAVGAVLLGPLQEWLTAAPHDSHAQVGGRHIGMDDVAVIEQTTDVYRTWDERYGGDLHRESVLGQLLKTNNLLANASYSKPVGRRLRLATADLCGLVGWMAFDCGLHKFAQRYWTLGIHHAHDAGDRELAGYFLYEQASQMMHLGRPGDALELLQMAQYGARNARSPHLRAWLLSCEAGAHARLGNTQELHRTLGQAEEVLSGAPADEPVPTRLAFVTQAHLARDRGTHLRRLAGHQDGRTRRASLTTALDSLQVGLTRIDSAHTYQRIRARYLASAVETYTTAGEYDEAAVTAEQLADAIKNISSVRTRAEIHAVRQRLGAEPTDPRIRTLAEHLDRAAQLPLRVV